MDAHGAIDWLLGRLTTVLVNEAQLLGRVRSDVEFIKDEMESMNGLILHLTKAQCRDHQVRTWMKQVVGLTRDCDGNVELYIHYVGRRPGGNNLVGYLRQIPWFLRTIRVRHRVAARIQELKVRARDVGDRRQRYAVIVPTSSKVDMLIDGEHDEVVSEEYLLRRAIVLGDAEPPADAEVMVQEGIDTLIKYLSLSMERAGEDGEPQVRPFFVLGRRLANKVADGVYRHPSLATLFNCKAFIQGNGRFDADYVRVALAEILEQVAVVQSGQAEELTSKPRRVDVDKKKGVISKIQGHLKGKRFLILVTDVSKSQEWKRILDDLLHAADGCLTGSAIVMTTDYEQVATSSSAYKIINARSLPEFYRNKAGKLNPHYPKEYHRFFEDLHSSGAFAWKMFLHLVYVNPILTTEFFEAIGKCIQLNKSIAPTMILFCYNELPIKYRSCLLYLAIFPQGHIIKTTSLARRLISEGFITTTRTIESESSVDEAEQCWDVLFARGFISPMEISAEGNIKTCILQPEVHQVISEIARDVIIVDTNLPTHLAHHLSVHNRIGLSKSHSAADSPDIANSLPTLAASPQWQLLKVLDLEGCHGLEKKHLKSICKILLLKYLSLRNTDVAELPKQIKELQCLETLDVRETKVRVLAKKATVLPLLKHFLAGHKVATANDSTTSEDLFSAVQIPLCIEKMTNMEILSHVLVSNTKDLAGIAQLLKLRKLGVTLHGKHAKLSDLFCEIEKMHRCLRSLSIRIDPQGGSEIQDVGMVDSLHSTPQFIERLNISGITGGLRHLIQEHPKLTKITLCEVHLNEDDFTILGKLGALQYLRFQHNSYTTESEIVFRVAEFQTLNYLLVEGKDITKITFASGAAPKLERIVWLFDRMDALSGLNHLTKLKKLELNDDCVLDSIKDELLWHPNNPIVSHKPHKQHQEDRCQSSSFYSCTSSFLD